MKDYWARKVTQSNQRKVLTTALANIQNKVGKLHACDQTVYKI